MNIEETDQLTTNIEPDPPGYRPAKKKAAAKKATTSTAAASAARAKANKAKKVPAKKATPKKVPTKRAKVGKSTRPSTPSSASAKRVTGGGGKKPGKSPSGSKSLTGAKSRGLRTNKPGKSGAGKTPKPSRPSSAGSRVKSPASSTKPGKSKARAGAGALTAAAVIVDPSALKPDRLYGITRVNQPHKGNLGWWLRIGPKGSRHDQFFADKKNGGEAKALKLATAKRNELYAALPDKLKRRGAIKRKVVAA